MRLIFVLRYLAIFIAICFSLAVRAIEAPRVDGIRWVNSSQVEITWSVAEVGPIYGYARCNSAEKVCAAGIGVRAYWNGHGMVHSAAGGPQIYVNQNEDLNSVVSRFIQYNGRGGRFIRNSDTREYSSYCGSFVTASYTVTDFSGMIAPWAPCFNIPVVPVSCSVSSAALDISHGALAPAAVNGSKASVNFSITCNRDVNINFALAGGVNDVKLSNNITSRLSLSTGELNKVQLIRGNIATPLTLISTLATTKADAGLFSGNTVVYMNFP